MQRALALGAFLSALASAAHADPCTAPVTGYQPGDVVRGRVVYAVDGDGLCLELGHGRGRWLEIREARWFAPELSTYAGFRAREVMRQQVGRGAVCTVARGFKGQTFSYDRVIASCRIDGQPIGQIMRDAGVKPGGRGR